MSEQRIDPAAEQATRMDPDAGDGQGLATPGSHPGGMAGGGGAGSSEDQPVLGERAERQEAATESDAPTEGQRVLEDAQQQAPALSPE